MLGELLLSTLELFDLNPFDKKPNSLGLTEGKVRRNKKELTKSKRPISKPGRRS